MSNDPSQPIEPTDPTETAAAETLQLEQSTYEIIKNRLASFSTDLQQRLKQLNEKRKNVLENTQNLQKFYEHFLQNPPDS